MSTVTVAIIDCEKAGIIGGPYLVQVVKDGRLVANHSGLSRTRAEQRQTELGDVYGIYGEGHNVTYLPHVCRCCGEDCDNGRDCCTDNFPEPGEVREWA
jgi:hypothetical protein